ncbi:Hydrogenase maturation protein, carbamoyltransferase HypF [Lutibacter agarilyticus]|uniref:Carbamoyltransferase n=1 Tax=Lutibacter agarilyticus TaxID=1109740 RepID=A0A238YBY4_9FLAO|nr:carbamoyltransferase HypF [Lutibacter agarilyticus]SNR68261.1 Hydrogenase maturation protein, carbamoyltransferase HypF [Lutibacter agarilyticus]
MIKTYKISISGQVQGVGFRPYVYNLAHQFLIKGTVSNNEVGVIIFISGEKSNSENFYQKLISFPPPVSKIQQSSIKEIEVIYFNDFKIIPSEKGGQLNLPLTPDFAICDTCKTEIKNPKNTRYNYPFTTCVNCGPRWAITQTFPFERNNTSIHKFTMCKPCLEEYTNPSNRRFHSQTNTCKTCGIDLFLIDSEGKTIETSSENLFKKTAKLLLEGKIIAIKNTSGYLLCCNAENSEVIQQLRTKKNRLNKPFAVLFPSLKHLENEIELNQQQIGSLTSSESPINIISTKNYIGNLALNKIAPRLNQLGVLLPYTGILQLIANQLSFPIVATSGNIHGSPIISKNNEALEKLQHVADYFLQHNLTIEHPQDDSVVKFSKKFQQKILFRRSRGYAPNYLNIKINSEEKILAMGAHLKSTIAFYPNENLYVSQYLGNLDNYDVYNQFCKTSENFIQLFEQQPQVILVDKHPLYQSTQYGKELAVKYHSKLIAIQHHKAHFTAILGEYNLFEEQVLGVVFDGTGYGDDTHIWGGEFFSYENKSIKRIGYLENFDWLLGDKMAKEPRISLFALASEEMKPILEEKFSPSELKNYAYLKSKNKLKTSSVGRLFDAVASLLNITDINSYEGEAAILLENSILGYNLKDCTLYCEVTSEGFSGKEILKNCYKDLQHGISKEDIIYNFLFTLASTILKFATEKGFQKIAFSGGVFQNTTLVDMLIELAPKEIKLYFHKELSPNDENISFGQIMYYLNIK